MKERRGHKVNPLGSMAPSYDLEASRRLNEKSRLLRSKQLILLEEERAREFENNGVVRRNDEEQLLGGSERRPTSCIFLATWLFVSLLGATLIGLATLTVNRVQSSREGQSQSFSTSSSSSSSVGSSSSESSRGSSPSFASSVMGESFNLELSNIQSFIKNISDDSVLSLTGSEDEEEDEDENEDEENTDITTTTTTTTSKPNVVFVLADDLGFNSIGDQDLDLDFATSFLSKMAEKGIILSNYYTQESCTPARAALLTGRYPLSIGMQLSSIDATGSRVLPIEETLLSEVLQQGGYTTYMLGKWNLGHYHPKYLPVSRGFDYYLGYMDGQTYYWSKKNPKETKFKDLTYGDSTCYAGYDGTDRHDYSTFLYRDKAVNAIEQHDFTTSPMFMYVAFQAVHDPFYDFDQFESGIPISYLSSKMYKKIMKKVKGRKRRQYAMALSLLDDAVESIHDALDAKEQLENSYIIFTSDNGGCYNAGGKNGDYRGTKGSLFEGGTKVDAFIYSKGLVSSDDAGTKYTGLMHVTDWFPTILDMVGLSSQFSPDSGYALDGVSQWSYLTTSQYSSQSARDYMLYNYIVNINGSTREFDIKSNSPVAVRNKEGFKLIHAFDGLPSSEWYQYDDVQDDDGEMHGSAGCSQADAMEETGTYTYFLFDLNVDPYETTNLYDMEEYSIIKNMLYQQIESYYTNSAVCMADSTFKTNLKQKEVWADAGNYIVPWADYTQEELETQGYPYLCSEGYVSASPFAPESSVAEDEDEDEDEDEVEDEEEDEDSTDTTDTTDTTDSTLSPTPSTVVTNAPTEEFVLTHAPSPTDGGPEVAETFAPTPTLLRGSVVDEEEAEAEEEEPQQDVALRAAQ